MEEMSQYLKVEIQTILIRMYRVKWEQLLNFGWEKKATDYQVI